MINNLIASVLRNTWTYVMLFHIYLALNIHNQCYNWREDYAGKIVFWILQICFPNPTFILIRSGNYNQDFFISPWRSWWSRCCKRLFRKHRIFWSSSFWKGFCSSFWNLSIGLHEWAQSIWSENSLFLFRPFHFLARSAWVEYRCYSYAQQYLNP